MVSAAIIMAIIGAGMVASGVAVDNSNNSNNTIQTYNTYRDNLEAAGYGDMTMHQVLDRMHVNGQLNTAEYKDAVKMADEAEEMYNKPDGFSKGWFKASKSYFSNKKMQTLINKMNDELPDLKIAAYNTAMNSPEDIRNAFLSSMPSIKDVAGPAYQDTSFKNNQREVKPVKLWTGQELADLHSLDYNPDNYYNLIKQGTSANVERDKFISHQMNEASMRGETKAVNTYLDMVRNSKAEAMAKGITAGQQAAREVLANTAAIQDNANSQAQVAQDRHKLVTDSMLADAQAKLTARNYFDKLAQHMSTDSMSLYANDTERFGGDWNANAIMHRGDEALRQARIAANGAMAGAYLGAQAEVNAARAGLAGQADEYAWVFDKFLTANKGSVTQANADMLNYINKQYTGYSGPVEQLMYEKK